MRYLATITIKPESADFKVGEGTILIDGAEDFNPQLSEEIKRIENKVREGMLCPNCGDWALAEQAVNGICLGCHLKGKD